MKLADILSTLQNENPIHRTHAARVLGMVIDVDAMEAITQAFKTETDPNTKLTMQWAGQRLYEAKKAGRTTLDFLFESKNLNKELENLMDAEEKRLMDEMQRNLDSELLKIRNDGTKAKLGLTLAAGLAGAVAGGVSQGIQTAAMASTVAGNSLGPESNMTGPHINMERIPPSIPTDGNYSIWMKRLEQATSPKDRVTALREIGFINNPVSLPPIAEIFIKDTDASVKATAQKVGNDIYWNMRYWNLTQDGTIDAEFARRAAALGKAVAGSSSAKPNAQSAHNQQPVTSPQPKVAPKEATPEEIAAILARAEKARQNRRRR